jgi:LPXTG-motif cell wall-anchored protein
MDGSTIFMIIMGVLLVALIGVFFYLRKQRSDE